ncbi:MAG TPA: GNAT family N-acetyltransferase [Acidimicrobiales bacterium]|nr:GNAT family N-acetyltransferase [Acidimicrobiales bacterium]
MTTTVLFTDRPEVALEAAYEHLVSQPVEHNLVLSLLRARARHFEPGRYWVAAQNGRPRGVVFQSPEHFRAAITPMADDMVDALVAAVVESGVMLPGVVGEARTAARFAGQWTELHAAAAAPSDGQRIYELIRLVQPVAVPGELRQAGADDRDLIVEWMHGFDADTGEQSNADATAGRRIAAGLFWLWDDDGARSMAAHSDPAESVVRIQAVYTPPEQRNRGYSGACVSALSSRLLGRGLRCMLYTDLGNPVSNSLYRRLGYRAVAEGLRYDFIYRSAG